MTQILTVNKKESIWMLADRRLSIGNSATKDDACKIMILDTTDGTAILGYSGLGATGIGTEPADWMGATLRGRKGTLEQYLEVLAKASKNQLPKHMIRMAKGINPVHSIIIPAFVGNETRFYSIDIALSPNRKKYSFRYTRHICHFTNRLQPTTPPLRLVGSGAKYLAKNTNWMRSLHSLVKAYDKGHASPLVVADFLANLNNEVHLNIKSVGPRCIIVCRNKKGGVHKIGGTHYFYTGTKRDNIAPALPMIAVGFDVRAISNISWEEHLKMMKTRQPLTDSDKNEFNRKLALIPDEPNENLQ